MHPDLCKKSCPLVRSLFGPSVIVLSLSMENELLRIQNTLDSAGREKIGTRKKERQGGRRDEEEGGTRKEEGREGRRDKEEGRTGRKEGEEGGTRRVRNGKVVVKNLRNVEAGSFY